MYPEDGGAAGAELRESSGMTIRLEGFEGPLDLLLYLIKREEIDIWNIPISRITEQYLEYLELMKDLNINLAAEWLVMAATLIHIKSRMLLPEDRPAASEGEPSADPRTELVYQLLEHQKFKSAAQMLHSREEIESAVWNRPPPEILEEAEGMVTVSLFDLLRAFHEVVKRFTAERPLEVELEEVTLEAQIAEIRRLLLVHDSLLFSSLFRGASSKRRLIVTFLALLELVRLHEVWLYQKRPFEEIQVTKGRISSERI